MARAMKDSGIDTIGKVPLYWTKKRLKYLCSIQTGNEDTQNADPDGEYPFYVRSPIVERCERYTFDGEGILVAGDGAGAGRIFHHVYGKYAVHQRVYRLANFVFNSDFIYYYLSCLFPFEMDKGSAQSTVPSMRLPMLMNFPIYLPDGVESSRIIAFLDAKCNEISTLMADIQAQIETLEQYKRSVITEAVTKGLNPNIPLKDGGTDWIGQIPIHWSISKIKYEILPIERVVYETDGIITCFRNGEVTLRSNRREEGFTISLTENGYHGVDVGDLVIHGMDAFAGAIGCSDSRGKISPVVHVCRTTGNNRFFMYFLRTMAYGDILMDLSDGVRIRSSDYRNFSKLGKLSICVPPLDEQDKIVDYLDSKVKQIDDVITQKQEQLEILEEYKKSVVFEYVTGKKEVPISCPQSAMKQ